MGSSAPTAAKLTVSTIFQFFRLLRLSEPRLIPDVFLACCLPLIIAAYVCGGYYLILAPGTLYAALVANNRADFGKQFSRYAMLAVGVLLIKVVRGALRESCSLILRDRLTRALHSLYVVEGDDKAAPPFLLLADGQLIDNPDQRVVSDVRDFASAVFQIMGGGAGGGSDSGGVIEASGSIVWYSMKTAERTGWIGIATAYGWSAIVAVVTVFIVNLTAPWVFRQEQLDAELRYGHVALREHAEEVAFLRGGAAEKDALNSALSRTIANGWAVIERHVYLNFVQYGFGYFVSLVMYAAIGVSIFSDLMSASSSSFSNDMSPGEKAKWISQTGGVFIQLLYSFTTVIQLGTATTAFVTNTTRVSQLADTLQAHHGGNLFRQVRQDEAGGSESEAFLCSRGYDSTGAGSSGTDGGEVIFADELVLNVGERRPIGPFSLRVEAGQRLLLNGPSGTGKTSILRAFRGLVAPQSGVFGVPNQSGSVLFSPQRPYIPAGRTLRELVVYPKPPCYSSVEEESVLTALRAVGWRKGLTVPLLDACDVRWASTISPGESQMISAARVLWHRPQFAILDEPTSALDSPTERRIFGALRDAGISILTAGHGEGLPQLHDAVVTIENDGGRDSGADRENAGGLAKKGE